MALETLQLRVDYSLKERRSFNVTHELTESPVLEEL